MGNDLNTRLPIECEAHERASARSADSLHRAQQRAVRLLSQFDSDLNDRLADHKLNFTETELPIMTYTSDDAIAASRRRITAGIAAFERATLSTPSAALPGVDTPDGLLDALGCSALANAAADLAALANVVPAASTATVEGAVIDGGKLVAGPISDVDTL